jgi:hypothetical protein
VQILALYALRIYDSAMQNEREWRLARAEVEAIRKNLPTSVSESLVAEYHAVLDRLTSASGENFDTLRISEAEITLRVVSAQRAGRNSPARKDYSKERYCDSNLFRRRLDTLAGYIEDIERHRHGVQSTEPRYEEQQAARNGRQDTTPVSKPPDSPPKSDHKVAIWVAVISAVATITVAIITGVFNLQQPPKQPAGAQTLPLAIAPGKPEEAVPDPKPQPSVNPAEARKRAQAIVQQLTSKRWELITHDYLNIHLLLAFRKDGTCDAKSSTDHPLPSNASAKCNGYSVSGDSLHIFIEGSQDSDEWLIDYSLTQNSDVFFRGTEKTVGRQYQEDEPLPIAELRIHQ